MTQDILRALNMTCRVLFTDEFLDGTVKTDFADHLVDASLDRTVDLTTADKLIERVMGEVSFENNPESSDSWLAPRLHAALRLRRAEAADRRIWSYLAAVRYPDYVRWRFPGSSGATSSKRFIGGDRDNALSRLWWGAEMTRNGSDYRPTVGAFERQDIPNTWFALDAFHNKAAALAALRMLPTMGARPINRLSTAFNHYLTTIMLDSIAPTPLPDIEAMSEWVSGIPDADDLLSAELPTGPLEDPLDEGLIDGVESLVRRVAQEVGIALD